MPFKYLKYHEDKPDDLSTVGEIPVFDMVPFGPGLVHHNIPCFVCYDALAVESAEGTQPCWDCQRKGMRLVDINVAHRQGAIKELKFFAIAVAFAVLVTMSATLLGPNSHFITDLF